MDNAMQTAATSAPESWNPVTKPFRVTFFYSSNSPGLHGWYSKSEVFATLDEALLVAACLMRKGQMEVRVDVAKNRTTWNAELPPRNGEPYGEPAPNAGYWEHVLSRKNSKPFYWAKGWSQARANKVAAYFAKKALS